MIDYEQGNLLDAQCEALVNAVNTVGIMGKGIALQFKQRFPENFRLYAKACSVGQVCTGQMFVTETGDVLGPRWIVNFPTKQHWREPSRLEWIRDGLQDLRRFIIEYRVTSVALPALGAGLGGLSWPAVRELIEQPLGSLEAEILVFEPMLQKQASGGAA